MDEANKTHLGAIFGPGDKFAAPWLCICVSFTWRAIISFLVPVCIFRDPDSDQITVRVNKCVLKWVLSSRSGLVCHSSLLMFIGGPAGDSSPVLVVTSWGESIFWQLIITGGIFCLRVLVYHAFNGVQNGISTMTFIWMYTGNGICSLLWGDFTVICVALQIKRNKWILCVPHRF